jgi:hypothetical protein
MRGVYFFILILLFLDFISHYFYFLFVGCFRISPLISNRRSGVGESSLNNENSAKGVFISMRCSKINVCYFTSRLILEMFERD